MVSRKNSLIQDYSKGMDLSPEGLRYYERKGIIHPQRDPDSGYRYYGFSDTLAISTCRKMRSWGYTLDEASDLLKDQSFEEQKRSLKEHERSLEKELERQKLILERLKESETVISDSLDHLEIPQETVIPDLFFLPTRIEEETIRNSDLLKQINSWNRLQPFPSVVLLNDGKQIVTGLAVNRKYMKILDLPWQEEIPSVKGTSLSLIQNMKELQKGNFRTKAEEILKQNLNDKRMIVFLLSTSMKETEMKVLCRIMIPD